MFEHHRRPVPRRSRLGAAVGWVAGRLDDLAFHLRDPSRMEVACMAVGMGGMALALGVTVAQATMHPVVDSVEGLRKAVVSAEFDGALCPDGWAADHAALLGMAEAEVSAWYLRESFELSDREVIAGAGVYLSNARDFRHIAGPGLTRSQILLCIAESRRLTQPLEALLPPHLRAGDPTDGA